VAWRIKAVFFVAACLHCLPNYAMDIRGMDQVARMVTGNLAIQPINSEIRWLNQRIMHTHGFKECYLAKKIMMVKRLSKVESGPDKYYDAMIIHSNLCYLKEAQEAIQYLLAYHKTTINISLMQRRLDYLGFMQHTDGDYFIISTDYLDSRIAFMHESPLPVHVQWPFKPTENI